MISKTKKSPKIINNKKNIFSNTSKQFYTLLNHINPYSNNTNIKITDSGNSNKSSEPKNNPLNKSFITNNFIKRFNLSQNEKIIKKTIIITIIIEL